MEKIKKTSNVLSSYAIECGCIFDQSPGDMCRLERHKSLHSIVFQVDVCPFVSPYEWCETNPQMAWNMMA
jgi:hypothetical protein